MRTKPRTKNHKGRRAIRFRMALSAGNDIECSLRYFKTQASSRSKLHKWRILPIPVGPIREIAIRRVTKRRKVYTRLLGFRVGTLALIILGLCGAGYSSQHVFAYRDLQPVTQTKTSKSRANVEQAVAPEPSEPGLARSDPQSLRIGSIDVDVKLVPVGLSKNDEIEVPPPERAGWYEYGPTPGEIGPAVIVGHVDNYDKEGIFWRLRELEDGDTFKVAREDGTNVKFQVESVKQYDKSDFPTDKVYGGLDYAGIRLITCGGQYDPAIGTYDQNTVLYGRMISSST